MKEHKKAFNALTLGAIALDILIFILGAYFIAKPTTSANIIGYVFGILLIIVGIYNIIKFIVNMGTNKFFLIEIISGILTIIAGIFMVYNPFSLANITTIGVGIWLIISATIKGAIALQFKKFNEETWMLSLIIAVITLILGILIIVNPFESYIVLAVYVGVMVCVYAAMDIVQQILFRKRVKEIVKIFLNRRLIVAFSFANSIAKIQKMTYTYYVLKNKGG